MILQIAGDLGWMAPISLGKHGCVLSLVEVSLDSTFWLMACHLGRCVLQLKSLKCGFACGV